MRYTCALCDRPVVATTEEVEEGCHGIIELVSCRECKVEEDLELVKMGMEDCILVITAFPRGFDA